MLPQCENASVRSISREVDLAWLAGILDGEGCLELTMKKSPNGKKYLMPKVRVYNTDVRMIEKVSQIYCDHNLVFFYTLGNNGKACSDRTGKPWKTQIGICIASQGSTRKLLELVLPFLGNKRTVSEIIIETIKYVQGLPKGGNTSSYDYSVDEKFIELMGRYKKEHSFYIDPSTIARRAREAFVVIRSGLMGDHEREQKCLPACGCRS